MRDASVFGERWTSRIGVMACVAIGVAIGLMWQTDGMRADASGETYVLEGFEIQYPYQAPETGESDTTKAGVSYLANWTGESYPGVAECEIALSDAAGQEVGRAPVRVSAANPDSPDARSAVVPVAVLGAPSTAAASCDGGIYPSGAGYEFEGLAIRNLKHPVTGEDMGTKVIFAVRALGTEPMGMRTCELDVAKRTGRHKKFGPYNVFVSGATSEVDVDIPIVDGESIAEAQMTCTELRS